MLAWFLPQGTSLSSLTFFYDVPHCFRPECNDRALSVPAVYFAYAMNNRRHGVIEGKRAHQYSVTGQAHPGQDKAFEGHPPVERSGGGERAAMRLGCVSQNMPPVHTDNELLTQESKPLFGSI